MRYSKLFGKATKSEDRDAQIASHRLLLKAGFIKESVAGRYYFLPLGIRVYNKIINIIREEMNAAGAQEILAPVLHPLELWQETNRTNSAGFELMRIKDRRGAEFALGGTAEEMMVDLARKYQLSYKDLPFNIYQFSAKFRDELRVRGGLLRTREFTMKDAYSFHADEQDFKQEYQNMWQTYSKIYRRLGLETVVVESDNGYIGGEYCHEFIVLADAGESKFFITNDGSYAAHEDIAKFQKYQQTTDEELKEREDVLGKGIIGVKELADYLQMPVEKTTKTILFETDKGEVVAAAVNGIYDINETKLMHILHCNSLQLASAEVVKKVTGAEVGYAGILNLPKEVIVIMDDSLRGRTNFECGANKTDYHSININFGRDLPEPEQFYDIALAKDGYQALNGQTLHEKRGIEVGNIFQLGYHYSKLMQKALFTAENGEQKPYYMGCYGIGISRTLAAIVELFHDAKGIIWPKTVAPYQAHLISLANGNQEIQKQADETYEALIAAGIEVLYDDRDELPAGEKFADADLIGLPYRLVVSSRSAGKIELKARNESDSKLVTVDELLATLSV